MYKWPQGRVIRTICLLLLLLIGIDLAYNGAYGPLSLGFGADGTIKQLIMGGLFAALAAVVVFGGVAVVGFVPRCVDFLIEVEQEMTKVEWPAGNALVRSTIVIFLMTVLIALIIMAVDAVNFAFFTDWLPALFHKAFGV
jgi:preprotein translocase SecE subunit